MGDSMIKPRIFLSHISSDATIAQALADVIKRAFAGAIECWFSSDQSPAGGLAPGDEWYAKLHEQLGHAESVFAIVTPSSIQRPWIFWESAIGSVKCPGKVVPMVFGLSPGDLQAPLNYFQAIDGLDASNLATALLKVADDAGLAPDKPYLESICAEFVEKARDTVQPGAGREEASRDEKVVAMLMGPLQNLQQRLEGVEVVLDRLAYLQDRTFLSGREAVARAHRDDSSSQEARWRSLSAREREVLRLAFRGLSSREVADTLHVSKRTVDYHLASVFEKLGVSNRVEAAQVIEEMEPGFGDAEP